MSTGGVFIWKNTKKMRLKFIFYVVLLSPLCFSKLCPAFFPFTGEDAITLGRGKFQLELQGSYYRYYDKTKHTDQVFQLTYGLLENMDLALIVPYSSYAYSGGEKVKGFGDIALFVKHVPVNSQGWRLGYKLQANFDTGKEGIGYGKTTGNMQLMVEKDMERLTFNMNLVYIKRGHIEELRDAYGAIAGLYYKAYDNLTLGWELKLLRSEQKGIKKPDSHVLLGAVYSVGNVGFSFGVHKTLIRHQSFADWGLLAGLSFVY